MSPYRQSSGPAPYNLQVLTGTKALSATTFAQDQINLPNCPEGILPGLLRVIVQRATGQYLDAAGDVFKVHLSTKSQDAHIRAGDPDAIASFVTESKGIGTEQVPLEHIYEFPAPCLISMKQIWMGFYATHAQTVDYRIEWVPRPSSVPQRDNLVSQLQF